MTNEQQQIYDKILNDGAVSDLIESIQNNIKILSSRLDDIRSDFSDLGREDGEAAVRIFKELESLHSQLSDLAQRHFGD
jgi:hypothetical protein